MAGRPKTDGWDPKASTTARLQPNRSFGRIRPRWPVEAVVFGFATSLLLVSCAQPEGGPPVDPLDRTRLSELSVTEVARAGGNDHRDAYILVKVGLGTFLQDGGFAVTNGLDREVKVFDEKGILVQTLGRKGSGPGEFRAISGLVALADGRFLVWDAQLIRLTYFQPDGELETTVTLNLDGLRMLRPSFVGSFPDGTVVMRDQSSIMRMGAIPSGIRRDTVDFVRFGRDGEGWEGIISWLGPEYSFSNEGNAWGREPLLFGRELIAEVVDTNLMLASTDSIVPRFFDADGHLTLQLEILRPVRTVTVAQILSEKERRVRLVADGFPLQGAFVIGGSEAKQARIRLMEEHTTLPAFSTILSDSRGHFWIREYAPEYDAPQVWFRTSSGFRPTGWIKIQANDRVLDAQGDRLLVLRKDALDVETVLVLETEPQRDSHSRGSASFGGGERCP